MTRSWNSVLSFPVRPQPSAASRTRCLLSLHPEDTAWGLPRGGKVELGWRSAGAPSSRVLFLLRALRMRNQSQRLSWFWFLAGLRVAEVSRWVTKFSSFCKAKQHFPPLGSSHRFPEVIRKAGAIKHGNLGSSPPMPMPKWKIWREPDTLDVYMTLHRRINQPAAWN